MTDRNCSDCSYYQHINDEYGMDARCGGLCFHPDSVVHKVPGCVDPNNTCVNWQICGEPEDTLPFSDPPESDEPVPSKAETLVHLRAELDKGKRFVALMERFIAVLESEHE